MLIFITHVDASIVCLFVCLSVCFHSQYIWKTDAARITNLTQKCSTTSLGNPFILGQKVIGEGHGAQNNYRSSDITQYSASCVRKQRWTAGFSLRQCPAAQAMLATPGFPRVTCDRQTAAESSHSVSRPEVVRGDRPGCLFCFCVVCIA